MRSTPTFLPALFHANLFIATPHPQCMRRMGIIDVIFLSLDSLKNQPSLLLPILFSFILCYLIFSTVFKTFEVSQLLENLNQLIVVSVALYLVVVSAASIVCGMTKTGIVTGESTIGDGLREAETHIFSVIVAFMIVGIISGILLIGGILVVTQLISEAGVMAALLYAFVIQLSFMLGILFLYALPAIIIDELDSITAIGLSIGIVLNHLRESMVLAFLALVSLVVAYFVSMYIPGIYHYILLLLIYSLVVTLLVMSVTVDYVNLK